MRTGKVRIVFVHNPVGADLECEARKVYGDMVEFMAPSDASKIAGGYDALMTRDRRLDPGLLVGDRLRWVHALSHGFAQLLSDELVSHKSTVTNSRGCHSVSVAEHLFSMYLALARRLDKYRQQQHARTWEPLEADTLFEKTMCIIGVGSIGTQVAQRAKAFGMRVVGIDPEAIECDFLDELHKPESLDRILPEADAVSVCVPFSPLTRNMLDSRRLGLLKDGAYLLNIARGGIVDEVELSRLLREERLGGAGFDVFGEEPLPETSGLWDCPNMIVLPHSASQTVLSRKRLTRLVIENIRRFLQQEPLINVVKPGSLPMHR